jgi:hypothetical protein
VQLVDTEYIGKIAASAARSWQSPPLPLVAVTGRRLPRICHIILVCLLLLMT